MAIIMRYYFLLLCLVFLWNSCALAPPEPESRPNGAPPGKLPEGMIPFLEQTMPVDRNVQVDTLDNGLRYFIRSNGTPANRLELRLAVQAGSVLEEEDQQGLAYFVGRMALNGTEGFTRQELADFLESTGMAFGPEVNVHTGFGQTVYELQVPTDSDEALEKAFRLLEDWAHRIDLAGEEIDRVRSAMMEEGYPGTGVRRRDLELAALLRGSRYAERLPRGQRAVLDTFHPESLRDFYRTWYRPELMAVVAVGDCDPLWVERQIRARFGGIPPAANPRARRSFPVPDREEALFVRVADAEATDPSAVVYRTMDVHPQQTVGAYRRHLVELLYHRMLNQRLYELTVPADPPFLSGRSGKSLLVRTKEAHVLACRTSAAGIPRGLEALLTEGRRVGLHGFTRSELEREKKGMLRFIEAAYQERGKTESRSFAEEYLRHFLTDEPIPGIDYEYGLYQTFLPKIDLEEVDQLAGEWNSRGNRVIVVSLPEEGGSEPPTEKALREILTRVETSQPEPYPDDDLSGRLMEDIPAPVAITTEESFPGIGVTEWILANGIRVVLKPMHFEDEEILFSASSPGGLSLVADEEYVAGLTADAVVREGGVAHFDRIALGKMLAGQAAQVTPRIDELAEGLRGGASPEDVETLFQLIYLRVTAPRPDSTACEAYRTWLRGRIESLGNSPEAAFRDTVQVTLAQHHFRERPWSVALLDEMDLDVSLRIYRERFGDAGDFTFFFVGDFTLDRMRPLAQIYLGNLPSAGRRETWRDVGIRPPRGVVEKYVYGGLEEKSLSRLVFTGDFTWSYENFFALDALARVLRSDLGEGLEGAHGMRVGVSAVHFPDGGYRLSVGFGCDPQRVEELTQAVLARIDSLARFGPDTVLVQRVKEMQHRQDQAAREENSFWLEALETAYYHGLDPRLAFDPGELIDSLTGERLRSAAEKYLKRDNYIRVVLLPERYKPLKK